MVDYAARRRNMVDTQVRVADVAKYPVIDAFLNVPRELFVPDGRQETAYVGENIPLGPPGRVIFEPRTLSKMLDAMNILPRDLVLDVGTGLGYSAAILARLSEAVVGLEEEDDLAREAEAAFVEAGIDNAVIVTGPLAEGAPQHGPYDAIVIEGGVETVPDALIDQLKDGGRIGALFMDGRLGACRIGWKSDGRVAWRMAFNAGAPVIPAFKHEKAFVL